MIFFQVELEKVLSMLSLIMWVGSFADVSNCGEKFSTRMDQDVFTKHRLRSRVIKSQPINRPLECHVKCMKNCRCLSYNVCNGGKLCELNSERKENNISLYEQSDECDYHEYEFTKLSPSRACLDPCCSTSTTCLYGARCQATCMKNNKRFQCFDCPPGHAGERCEILPRTCAVYTTYPPGLQIIYAPDDSAISVFCHFDSSTQIAMTLVMSFSRTMSHSTYGTKSLLMDFPRSEDSQNWADYRLSFTRMAGIRDYGSTHWMYTCSYSTRGLLKSDYLRSKFSETDILNYKSSSQSACTNTMEYINIGGKDCTNCATSIGQSDDRIFHVSTDSVNCGGLVGAYVGVCTGGTPVTLFGVYYCYWTSFPCTADGTSTTQLWFGEKLG